MKYLVNIVLVCTLFCACEKENDFPITLYALEVSRVSDIRLFVDKKEIYDPDVIRNFVGDSEYFKMPTNEDIRLSNEDICFLSSDSVLFGTIGFTVRKNANRFLFYSPKIFSGQVQKWDLVSPLLKYTDELIIVPATTGYSFITSEVRVGYGSYKNLELSLLSYMRLRKLVYNEEVYGEEFVVGSLFNEFNEEAINTLQLGDTLAIRAYCVRFFAK